MSGQIPKYGKNFERVSESWTPDLANRVFVLKRDPSWFIRSDKTSKIWHIYRWTLPHSRELATPVSTPLPTFGLAMLRLLDGIDRGFYAVRTAPSDRPEPDQEDQS